MLPQLVVSSRVPTGLHVAGHLHAPIALSPGKRPGTHCTGGCGLQVLSGPSREVSLRPGSKPWTVQPLTELRYRLGNSGVDFLVEHFDILQTRAKSTGLAVHLDFLKS
jgi:hypothetical protein